MKRASVPKNRRLRLLVLVSDLHCGSTVAVMPPRLKVAQQQVVEASPLQLWFWECWCHAIKWVSDVTAGDPFGLVLNGDLIEGDHHHTDEIISKRVGDHIACAEQVLEPLTRRAARTWIVRGTPCHVGDHEAAIGHRLGAECDPTTGRPVFDRLTMDVCGVRMVAKHHVGTTSRPWLEANALGAELASEQLNSVRNGDPMPRIVYCGHRHVAGHVTTGEGLCVVTSAWQGLTGHGHRVVSASRCRPCIYILDWRDVADRDLPRVRRRIYDAPTEKNAVVVA